MDKYQTLREKDNPANDVYPNIKTQNIPDGGVTTAKINDGAVTTAKINDGAVTTTKINNGAITESKLDAFSVSSAKIQSGAITNVKLATSAVSSAKIADGAVTHAKLGNASVYGNKIGQYAGYWFDHDWGEDFDDFVKFLSYMIKNGAVFYYTDDLQTSFASCSIRVTPTQVDIDIPLPLTGYQSTYTITSANFETWYQGEGSGFMANFIVLDDFYSYE